ncbi:MAG TPA: glycosyltransferase [Opitutaceae bacterium]|nr:glycosyltransferase [Opitutaceae bacterium]
MNAPLLLDLSHTSHTRARTGVQRVSRSLWRELGSTAVAVTHDPYEDAWRQLDEWEKDNLLSTETSSGRGAKWPILPMLRGRFRRLSGRPDPLAAFAGYGGLVVPEIFSADVGAALPAIFAASGGPRIAIFHDAIALQFPEFTPRSTVTRFPSYLQELLRFDGVAAVSEASRSALLSYWKWLGVSKTPEVTAVTLGIDPAPTPTAVQTGPVPIVLCVATIEGRKNHMALLEACEMLWSTGTVFQLRLVGLANSETGSEAISRISALRASGRNIRYNGALSDMDLETAYAECTLTVYPSFSEGFGLPVAESLSRGKPCACRMDGALGEIARAGGCKDIGSAAASEIASAIAGLLASPSELAELGSAASGRRFKTWPQYASELRQWMGTVNILS